MVNVKLSNENDKLHLTFYNLSLFINNIIIYLRALGKNLTYPDVKIQILLSWPLTFFITDVEAVFKISREFILGNLGQ